MDFESSDQFPFSGPSFSRYLHIDRRAAKKWVQWLSLSLSPRLVLSAADIQNDDDDAPTTTNPFSLELIKNNPPPSPSPYPPDQKMFLCKFPAGRGVVGRRGEGTLFWVADAPTDGRGGMGLFWALPIFYGHAKQLFPSYIKRVGTEGSIA